VSRSFTASYDPALETPALARHQLEGWLPDSLGESERGALRLLVSELVTNSVRHVEGSTQPVVLDVRIGTRAIRVEVHDGGAGFTPGKPEPRGADGGFGLFLVERMSSRWGVEVRDGTRVWFELDLASRRNSGGG
jgi:anti-sigma regulatory factor (Ser/Thr protein kinase)